VAHAAHKARQRRRKNERRHEAVGAILDRLQPPTTTPPTTTPTTTTPSAAAASTAQTFTPLEQVPAGQPAAGEAAIIDWRSMGAADPASMVGDGDEQAMRGGGGGGGGEGVLATRRGGGGGDEQAMRGGGQAQGRVDDSISGGGGGGSGIGGGAGDGGGGGGGSGGDGVSGGAAAAAEVGEVSLRAMRKRWQVESFALVILELQREWARQRALDPSLKTSAPAPMHIVDFGAGSGNLTLPLAKRFPDCTFTAVEMKQRSAELLESRAAAAGLGNVHAWVGMIERFNRPFDVGVVGPRRYCLPRQRMPFNSRNEGSTCV